MILLFGIGVIAVSNAGDVDSPGSPAQGSGMYSLRALYDYFMNGSPLIVQGNFQEPSSPPNPTMKNLTEIGDDIRAEFLQCNTLPLEVKSGTRFFCTQPGFWGVQTGTATAGRGKLLRTGQLVEYRYGDDGTYLKGADFNYTDNGDGTVTDHVTGLMWARDGGGPGCANGAMMNWNDAIDWAQNLAFAGYTDWRLPNLRELQSIVDYSVIDPSLDALYFPNTRHYPYLTSTTSSKDNGKAFYINFDNGRCGGTTYKHLPDFVRAVRSGR